MSKRYTSLKDYPGPNQTQTHEWATFLLSRNVQFKVHENLGHALNALTDSHAGILYKWNETKREWDEVLRVEGSKYDPGVVCANCDRAEGEDDPDGAYEIYIQRVWLDLKSDVPYLAYLCHQCTKDAKRLKVK